MSKLNIERFPSEVLRKQTVKVKDPLSKEIQALIVDMFETMHAAKGLGLAATQVGRSERICVIEEEGIQYVLINPQVTAKSTKKILAEEGCLSFPGEFMPIIRPEEVKVRFLDKDGKQCKIKAQGLLARALQHEIDHLDGILIIDRAKKKKVQAKKPKK